MKEAPIRKQEALLIRRGKAVFIGFALALATGCAFRVPINEPATLPSSAQKRPLSVSVHVSDTIRDLAIEHPSVVPCFATFTADVGAVITQSLTKVMEQSFEKVVHSAARAQALSGSQYHFAFLPAQFMASANLMSIDNVAADVRISLLVQVSDAKGKKIIETIVGGQSRVQKDRFPPLAGCEKRTLDVLGPAIEQAISSMLDDFARNVLASDQLAAH